jgi:hypothetical protein
MNSTPRSRCSKIITHKGPAIGIFRQYAYHGHKCSIHSSGQFEAYKNKVDDRSMKVGGKQCIRTNDGYVIPLGHYQRPTLSQMQLPNDAK